MSSSETVLQSSGPAETRRLGRELVATLGPGGRRAQVVLLRGEMGSGKTVLVQGMASALGIAEDSVQSPTYQLIHEHQGGGRRLVHVDLYRLEPEDVDSLGLDELLAEPGIVAIEWAERLPFDLPQVCEITVTRAGEDQREIRVLRRGSDPSNQGP